MGEQVVIEPRYNGPPDSGHGGWSCAVVAEPIDGPAEATLLAPPPLGRPLERLVVGDTVELRDGEQVVGRARAAVIGPLEPPVALSLAQARAAALDPADLAGVHPFPTCFACGPARAPGDGLRIFAGPADDSGVFAATWTAPAETDDRLVWAALDCPTSTPVSDPTGAKPIVLARLAVAIERLPAVGEEHAILAWERGRDGRKLFTAAVMTDGDGEQIARCEALWIELKPQDAAARRGDRRV